MLKALSNIKAYLDSITARLFLSFLFLGGVSAFILFFFLYRNQQRVVIETKISLLNSVNEKTSQMHEAQTDFLMYETINADYFKSKQSHFLERHEIIAEATKKDLQKLKSTDRRHQMESALLIKKVSELDTKFGRLVALIDKRGFKDFGIEGAMGSAVAPVEKKCMHDPVLLSKLLLVRENEKNYVIRKEEAYIGRLESSLTEFEASLTRYTGFSAADKAEMMAALREYRRLFEDLAEAEAQIGINSKKGLKSKIYLIHREVYDHTKEYSAILYAEAEAIRSSLQNIVVSLLSAFILLTLIMGYLVWNHFAKPIRRLALGVDEIVRSNFSGELRFDVHKSANEIGVLSLNMETMLRKMQANRQTMIDKNEELLKVNQDIQLLNQMGTEVTATFNIDEILNTIYRYVNQIMDASVFGIGIYEPKHHALVYRMALEQGKRFQPYQRDCNDKNQLAVWCLDNQKGLILGDYDNEIAQHIDKEDFNPRLLEDGTLAQKPVSVMYVPLMFKQAIMGVVSVQSYAKNAYKESDFMILQNLAVSIAVALDNAQAYSRLAEQHRIIDKKNHDITSSINYAKRIQEAFLPTHESIKKHLPECFILFKPRDIVSGDFYWFGQVEDELRKKTTFVIAAADCTGHGVPGAFMSMAGDVYLNLIVKIQQIGRPDYILNELHKNIREAFKQDETDNHDGMDVAVCTIDSKKGIVEYAGAKNPLIYIQNGELIEIKANRTPVGGHQKEERRMFTKHRIKVDVPTSFYIFTDGFADQFGGPAGMKMMKKNFKAMLLENSNLPMEEQKAKLQEALSTWQGTEHSQIDDILVIGFMIVPESE